MGTEDRLQRIKEGENRAAQVDAEVGWKQDNEKGRAQVEEQISDGRYCDFEELTGRTQNGVLSSQISK